MKLSKRLIVSASLLASALLLSAGLAIRSSAIKTGRLLGCETTITLLVPPEVSPVCGLRNNRLTLTVTNPILNVDITYDLLTGRILQDNE